MKETHRFEYAHYDTHGDTPNDISGSALDATPHATSGAKPNDTHGGIPDATTGTTSGATTHDLPGTTTGTTSGAIPNATHGNLHGGTPGAMPAPDRALIAAARAACATAYAPHTGFRVGAAARLRSGAVLTASNQESVAGPAGVCAERNLLYNHQANHADDPIEAIAIASDPDTREIYPCGMCRQVLADSEGRQGAPIRVIMSGHDSATVVESSYHLLPFRFEI